MSTRNMGCSKRRIGSSRWWRVLTLVAAGTLLSGLIGAAPARAQSAADGWSFSVTPRVWAFTVGGSGTAAPLSAPGSGPAAYPGLGLGREIEVEVGRARWSLRASGSQLGRAGALELPAGSELASGALSFSLSTGELLAAYRGGGGADSSWLSFSAGVRYVRLEQSVTLTRAEGGTSVSGLSSEWWDPLVGLHFHTFPHRRLGFTAGGELGGFGIGSEFTWAIDTGLVLRVSRDVELLLGYRLLEVDNTRAGTAGSDLEVYDAAFHGLRPGLRLRF